jgi:hypothetical protein
MRFYAFKSDLDYLPSTGNPDSVVSLNSTTSVRKLKAHFFECVRSLGNLTLLDENLSHSELASIFQQPDAVLAHVHRIQDSPSWYAVPKRTLAHSLGDFLLPDPLYRYVTMHRANTVYLVTAAFQKARLEKHLGAAAPTMAVFAPRLDETLFRPPTPGERTSARAAFGLSEGAIHIVYAGRWLATKGLCQLLRAFHLWPMAKATITVVGGFERTFPIMFASASHYTFPSFFRREFVVHMKGKTLRMSDPLAGEGLRNALWSADLFVYPSVHEDENFGMAPREAILCGVPVVVADFCGLHPLASSMPWGGVATYPTLCGPRYSVWQLRKTIAEAVIAKRWDAETCAVAVRKECDPSVSRLSMEKAVTSLLSVPLVIPIEVREAERKGRNELFRYANSHVVRAFVDKAKEVPDGALVDGMGMHNPSFPELQLLQAIQGFYTSVDKAPIVEAGSRMRGFFRVSLWREERAIVEFGFPGPRMKRYGEADWASLVSCVTAGNRSDITMAPRTKAQIALAQDLVDLGYVVPDQF